MKRFATDKNIETSLYIHLEIAIATSAERFWRSFHAGAV
jgi:hypothetical protein